MYKYREACRYVKGRWGFADLSKLTIRDVLDQSNYNVITLNTLNNEIALLGAEDLHGAPNKSITIEEFIQSQTKKYPLLDGDFTVHNAGYVDIDGIEQIGNDYLIHEDIPFIITQVGLWSINNSIARDINASIYNAKCHVIGKLDVNLPYTKHRLTKEDVLLKIGHLPKRFSYNNTLMIFGNTLLRINEVFKDIGDAYTYGNAFRTALIDMYIDNIDAVPPAMVGLDPNNIQREELNTPEVIAKLLSHPLVYFVEYIYEYPIGAERYYPSNEIMGNYSGGVVMSGNQPTIGKVVHMHDRYVLTDTLIRVNTRLYNDNNDINMVTDDRILIRKPAHVLILDYPVFKLKV